jgi:hypothetical protein
MPSCNAVLYLGRFEVKSTGSDHLYEQSLKKSLGYYLAARRAFPVISELPDTPDKLSAEFLILDGEVTISFSDDYNWWVTWPAVYPMTGYWPLQIRRADLTVDSAFTLSGKTGQTYRSFTSKKQASHEVFFYGFFRTSPIEATFQQTMAEVLRDTALQVAETAQCPHKRTEL